MQKLRTLLINLPEDIHEVHYNNHILQPYGLGMISSYLKQCGRDVVLHDACAHATKRKQLLRYIEEEAPNVLGITTMTHGIQQVADLLADAKKVLPGVTTVVGGPHPSAEYQSLLADHESIDIAVRGEGEYTMEALIDSLQRGGDLTEVQGLAFRKGEELVVTPARPPIADIDSLPFSDWTSFPMDKYWCGWTIRKNYASILFSRGCPFSCTFCAHDTVLGRNQRKRSPELIIEELKLLYDKFGVRQLRVDDSALIDRKWIQEICEGMLRMGRPLLWGCNVRSTLIDKELLLLMKKSGLVRLNFGIESADNRMLKAMKKGQTIEEAEAGIRLINEVGIVACYTFIVGLPGETEESLRKTVDFSRKLEKCFNTFHIATPYPGTEFYETAKKEGLMVKNWANFDLYKIAYVPKGLTKEILLHHYKRSLTKNLFKPSFILWNITLTESWINFKIRLRFAFHVVTRFLKAKKSMSVD
ncbi:MAG: radical SAM protein [Deltaproteobacteria bacterium]|nr:radical SAM protein [Deltaproteobacteria bacterium]